MVKNSSTINKYNISKRPDIPTPNLTINILEHIHTGVCLCPHIFGGCLQVTCCSDFITVEEARLLNLTCSRAAFRSFTLSCQTGQNREGVIDH